MKKVTIKFEYYFDDEDSDDDCIGASLEIQSQDRDINDDQIIIEHNVKQPKE